eukprot:6211861-Pleurochrysis_carterae.AAC.1
MAVGAASDAGSAFFAEGEADADPLSRNSRLSRHREKESSRHAVRDRTAQARAKEPRLSSATSMPR